MKPWIFAILAGVFTAIETSINAKLGKIISPNIATLHSLITGVFLIIFINIIRGTLSQYGRIIYVSPQWLIGGVFGAFIIYFVTRSMPQLGVSNTLTLIVAAQLISGLFIDTVILQQSLQLTKIAGIIFLLLGTYFVIM